LLNSPDAKVLYEQHSPLCFEFKLNMNKTLNSIDLDMVHLISAKLQAWNTGAEAAPRVAMVSGTGGKAFCAGGDIVSIYRLWKEGADTQARVKFFADEYLMDYSLTTMSPIQVALWNGIVMGGGVGVSCHAPIRIATEKSVYAMPETAIGFFCDVGGSYFLSRVKNNINLGLYLGLTGQRLKADDLVQWGVATHYVTTDKLDDLRQDIAANVQQSHTRADVEAIIGRYSDNSAADRPIAGMEHINEIFTPEGTIQDLMDRLEKKKDTEFAQSALKKINAMSPLSLAVVFEQIKRGQSMDLKSVFEMEYNMAQGFMEHTEFFEGVRALLVDKDRSPKWKHASIRDVTPEDVAFFFDRNEQMNLDISKSMYGL